MRSVVLRTNRLRQLACAASLVAALVLPATVEAARITSAEEARAIGIAVDEERQRVGPTCGTPTGEPVAALVSTVDDRYATVEMGCTDYGRAVLNRETSDSDGWAVIVSIEEDDKACNLDGARGVLDRLTREIAADLRLECDIDGGTFPAPAFVLRSTGHEVYRQRASRGPEVITMAAPDGMVAAKSLVSAYGRPSRSSKRGSRACNLRWKKFGLSVTTQLFGRRASCSGALSGVTGFIVNSPKWRIGRLKVGDSLGLTSYFMPNEFPAGTNSKKVTISDYSGQVNVRVTATLAKDKASAFSVTIEANGE